MLRKNLDPKKNTFDYNTVKAKPHAMAVFNDEKAVIIMYICMYACARALRRL